MHTYVKNHLKFITLQFWTGMPKHVIKSKQVYLQDFQYAKMYHIMIKAFQLYSVAKYNI